MLGYISKEKAINIGMTHRGSYYGISLWIAPDDPDFLVCAKWYPFEYIMIIFHHIEGFMRSIIFPDEEPAFQFKIGDEI